MWRIVCMVLGVLVGHLAVLAWLNVVPDRLVATPPPLLFHLSPRPAPFQPTTAPDFLKIQAPTKPKIVPGKVQKSRPMVTQTPATAAAPTSDELSIVTPSPVATTGAQDLTQTSDEPAPGSVNAGAAMPPSLSQPPFVPAVLPSSKADYLNNPAPTYPAISQRLGEQGKVMIRVLIGKDGSPLQGKVHQSSGYTRLDQAALRAVMAWRYVPGQRNGKAQDMWFNVPINFALN